MKQLQIQLSNQIITKIELKTITLHWKIDLHILVCLIMPVINVVITWFVFVCVNVKTIVLNTLALALTQIATKKHKNKKQFDESGMMAWRHTK